MDLVDDVDDIDEEEVHDALERNAVFAREVNLLETILHQLQHVLAADRTAN